MEGFVDIIGYKGLYKINKKGEVLSIQKNVIRKCSIRKNGYAHIGLNNKDGRKNFYIHRLLAENFLGLNTRTKDVVCHKDDNPSNNSLDNLMVGTQKQNIEMRSQGNRCRKKTRESFQFIKETILLKLINKTNKYSNKELAIRFHLSYSSVVSILNGINRKGLKFDK